MTSGNRLREFLLDTFDLLQIWCEGMSTLLPRWRVEIRESSGRLRTEPSRSDLRDIPVRDGRSARNSSSEAARFQKRDVIGVCETLQVFPHVSSTPTEGDGLRTGPASPTLH